MQLINALHNTIIEHLSWKCSGQSITQSNWEEGLNVSLSLYLKIASREWKLYKECNCSLPSLLVLLILLLLLSHFSPVWLCDQIHCSPSGSAVPGILQTRTLEWIAISFSNAWKWKVKSEVAQSCLTLLDPMDCSLPGSSVHGIFQARVLEWGATAFSTYSVGCVKMISLMICFNWICTSLPGIKYKFMWEWFWGSLAWALHSNKLGFASQLRHFLAVEYDDFNHQMW